MRPKLSLQIMCGMDTHMKSTFLFHFTAVSITLYYDGVVVQSSTTVCNAKPALNTHTHTNIQQNKTNCFHRTNETVKTHIKCNANDVTVCCFFRSSLQLCNTFICEVPVKINNNGLYPISKIQAKCLKLKTI